RVRMLATCSGAKSGASSITTRPAASSMYRVLAGSGRRQSVGREASSSSCVVLGRSAPASAAGAAAAAAAMVPAVAQSSAVNRGSRRVRWLGCTSGLRSDCPDCCPSSGRTDYRHIHYMEVRNSIRAMVDTLPPPDIEAALRKFQRELSSGVVALALLAVLSRGAEPMYGYEVARPLERFGDGVLSGEQRAL